MQMAAGAAAVQPKDSLSVLDNRTGKSYELLIKDGAINATALSAIKSASGAVTRSFDPAYMNTVNCISKISFINGEKGILEYRGYPIEQLAEKSTFLECTFLLMYGELPTDGQSKMFAKKISKNSGFHAGLEPFIKAFRHDAHPMGMMSTLMAALSQFYPEANPAYAGAVTALYGPRHGGANEAVLRMLDSIGHVDNIPQFIKDVKDRKKTLMGFGHRVYKNFDPRATIVRKIADDVFSIVGREPMIEIAMELERIALNDEFFIKRKLYPNVDFYSGVIYKALGIPTEMFTILFTLPRLAGWLAHWNEFVEDPDNKIVRPRQIYKGYKTREFVPVDQRKQLVDQELTYEVAYTDIRREASLNQ